MKTLKDLLKEIFLSREVQLPAGGIDEKKKDEEEKSESGDENTGNKNPRNENKENEKSEDEKPSESNNNSSNPLNQPTNETEIHESNGSDLLDSPDVEAVSQHAEGTGKPSGTQREERAQRGERGEEAAPCEEPGEIAQRGGQDSQPGGLDTGSVTAFEAYWKGYADGRNAKIEEAYFPREDNIPAFHGNAKNYSPASDFFSIAREA